MSEESKYALLSSQEEDEYYDHEQSTSAPTAVKRLDSSILGTRLKIAMIALLLVINISCVIFTASKVGSVARLLRTHIDITTSTRDLPRPDPYYELH